MNTAGTEIGGRTRRVMTAQLIVTAVLALGALLVYSPAHGLSVAYGGLVDVVLALLLGHSIRRANERAATDPKAGMNVLYLGAVIRFFLFIVLFAIGLGLLRLNALAVAAGFVAARIAQLASAHGAARTIDNEGLK